MILNNVAVRRGFSSLEKILYAAVSSWNIVLSCILQTWQWSWAGIKAVVLDGKKLQTPINYFLSSSKPCTKNNFCHKLNNHIVLSSTFIFSITQMSESLTSRLILRYLIIRYKCICIDIITDIQKAVCMHWKKLTECLHWHNKTKRILKLAMLVQ